MNADRVDIQRNELPPFQYNQDVHGSNLPWSSAVSIATRLRARGLGLVSRQVKGHFLFATV
jgi:hypothetical protein